MKLKLEVGEPRGFDTGDGTNTVEGETVDELSGSHEIEKDPSIAAMIQTPKGDHAKPETITEHWFVLTIPPVEFEGMKVTSLLLTPRYKTKIAPADTLKKGDDIVINGIWRQDGLAWDKQSIEAARQGELDVLGVIVGKVSPVKEKDADKDKP